MTTMQTTLITEIGARWALVDVDRPQPGPGEVLVQIRSSGICGTDPYITEGKLVFSEMPAVPGHEGVGEIVEIGASVDTRVVGDRVGILTLQKSCGRCDWCRRREPLDFVTASRCENPTLTGFNVSGTQADYIVVPASATVLLPDGLSYHHAAPIMCIGYTAWGGLVRAQPMPGETVAVSGVGGLGHLAIQYAKAVGLRTIAVTGSPDKADLARQLGADEVVHDGAGLAAVGGADILLSTNSSNAAVVDAMDGLAPRGRVVIMGIAFDDFPLANMSTLMERRSILGSAHNGEQYLAEALAMAADGRVTPMVEVFDKSQIAEAYERAASGKARFRVVVDYSN